MSQHPQSYTTSHGSNDSYRNPESKPQPSGSLMTGLAFGVGTQLANTSLQGIQTSGLHPHVENPESKVPLGDNSKLLNSTPIFSSKPLKGQDPCKNEMAKLSKCMDQNDENVDRCQSQFAMFRGCRRDNHMGR